MPLGVLTLNLCCWSCRQQDYSTDLPFAVERNANAAGISHLQPLLNFLSRISLADFKLHIGLISFAAYGKRLAWRATGNKVSATVPRLKILIVDVAFNERPMAN